MWVKMKDMLINLDNVTHIEKDFSFICVSFVKGDDLEIKLESENDAQQLLYKMKSILPSLREI